MVFPVSCPVAKGVVWQWEGDSIGDWHSYSIDVAGVLEDAYSLGLKFLDLSKSPVVQPYHIDLQKMQQKRIETGNVRMIRREKLSSHYPLSDRSAQIQTSSVQQTSHIFPNNGPLNSAPAVSSAFNSTASNAGSRKRKRPSDTLPNFMMQQSMLPNIAVAQQNSASSTSVHGLTGHAATPSSGYGSSSSLLTSGVQGPLTRNRYSAALANMNQFNVPSTSIALPGGQQSQSWSGQNSLPLLNSSLTGLGLSSSSAPFQLPGHVSAPGSSVFFGAQQLSNNSSGGLGNPAGHSLFSNVSLLGNSYSSMLPGITPHMPNGQVR